MNVQTQNEREALLAAISSSASIMQQIDAQEDIAYALDDKLIKAKKNCGAKGVVITLVLGTFATGIFMDTIVAIMYMFYIIIAMYWVLNVTKKNKLKKQCDEADAKLEAMRKDPSLNWLPPDYRTATAYKSIAEYLTNMRVDTLRDAINLYESEQHNARMEYIAAAKA